MFAIKIENVTKNNPNKQDLNKIKFSFKKFNYFWHLINEILQTIQK